MNCQITILCATRSLGCTWNACIWMLQGFYMVDKGSVKEACSWIYMAYCNNFIHVFRNFTCFGLSWTQSRSVRICLFSLNTGLQNSPQNRLCFTKPDESFSRGQSRGVLDVFCCNCQLFRLPWNVLSGVKGLTTAFKQWYTEDSELQVSSTGQSTLCFQRRWLH